MSNEATTLSAAEMTKLGYEGIAQNPLNRARAMCSSLAAVKEDSEGRHPTVAMDTLMMSVGFTVRVRAVPVAEIESGEGLPLKAEDHVAFLALPDGTAVGATKGRWTAVIKWVEAWDQEFLSRE